MKKFLGIVTIKFFFKYSWVFLFNIILILYSSELLLTIFLHPQVNPYIDLDYLRYQKAKELGADFDKRTYHQAFFEEKKKAVIFNQFFLSFQFCGVYGCSYQFLEN